MILATEDGAREAALAKLLPMQQSDFEAIFAAMAGLPVTVRLLDPPLHEFLPDRTALAVELALAEPGPERDRLEKLAARVRELAEQNPMLGTRGCRLALLHPGIYAMQVRAIVRGALAAAAGDHAAEIEIMIPLVAFTEELRRMRALVEEVVAEELERAGTELPITIGTMIELPRAALRAGEIAAYADFFSFGTNDLTQTTLGFSRDDAESGFLSTYLEGGVIERNPFASIDADGVGELVRMGVERGRAAKPGIKHGCLRRARRRSGLRRVLPRRRARLCVVLAVPGADRAARGGPRGARCAGVSEPAIDAALTPGEELQPCDVAIVVDTIRATTTALYALRQGYREVDVLRQRRGRAGRGRRDRRGGDPGGRARVRPHRGLPPRQLAARVRRRAAARRRPRADDDERHARGAAGAGRGGNRSRRRAREPLGHRLARRAPDARRARTRGRALCGRTRRGRARRQPTPPGDSSTH